MTSSELAFWPEELTLTVDDDFLDGTPMLSLLDNSSQAPPLFDFLPCKTEKTSLDFHDDSCLIAPLSFDDMESPLCSSPSYDSPSSTPPSSPGECVSSSSSYSKQPLAFTASLPSSPSSSSSASPSSSSSLLRGSNRSQGKTTASTAGRKRTRRPVCNTVPEANTIVTVSHDLILCWSSQQMEDFVAETRQKIGREFTVDEDKEIKRQRRLIKNRESALASRQRKKAEIDELVTQKDQLIQQMEELRAKDERIRELEKENQLLRAEVHSLRAIVAEQPAGFGQTFSTLSDYAASVTHSLKCALSVGDSGSSHHVKIKTEPLNGVYMLIFFFSFALFFTVPFSPSPTVPVKFPADVVIGLSPQLDAPEEKTLADPAPLSFHSPFPPIGSGTMRKPLSHDATVMAVISHHVQNTSADFHIIDAQPSQNNLTSPLQSDVLQIQSICTPDQKRHSASLN